MMHPTLAPYRPSLDGDIRPTEPAAHWFQVYPPPRVAATWLARKLQRLQRALRLAPPELAAVRLEFVAVLADLPTYGSYPLRQLVENARSTRELWHLRAEAFRQIALHHSQNEADERLARLNRHFPSRTTQSGFTPLMP